MTGTAAGSPAAPDHTIRSIVSAREFQALWAGQTQSAVGDQVARIALAVLVYDQAHSPLLTAVAYAGSYLPWIAGGLVLAAVADRWPRRTVLVACDLARCALIALIAVPGMPLAAMIALLYVATLLDAPFIAARGATFRDILPGDRYRAGITVATTSLQFAAMAGYAVGGILVSAAGARPALLADAATFAASALLITLAVARRPAAHTGKLELRAHIGGGMKAVFTSRKLRTCMFFGWLAALYTAPAAVAVPLAASKGGGAAAAGLIFAATPLGTAAGSAAYGRLLPPAAQTRWMGPAAAACCGSLALFLAGPGLGWSLAILVLSGSLAGYQVAANTSFVQALSRDQQAQAFGIATAGIWTIQGIAFIAAGSAADHFAAGTVIAAFGITGAILALGLTAAWLGAADPV